MMKMESEAPVKILNAFQQFKNGKIKIGLQILDSNVFYLSQNDVDEFLNHLKVFLNSNDSNFPQVLEIVSKIPTELINKEKLYDLIHPKKETEMETIINNIEQLGVYLTLYDLFISSDSNLMKKSLSFLQKCLSVENYNIQTQIDHLFISYITKIEIVEDALEFDVIDYFIVI
jgi:hypothetical protein